ncbi:MAG TPA: NADH-quinone oxidoreductase subunit NuoF [Spirochaetia bacterium]
MAKVGHRIVICAGTGCIAGGSLEVARRFETELAAAGIDAAVELKPEDGAGAAGAAGGAATMAGRAAEGRGPEVLVSKSGCQGFCQAGPLVTVLPENILYTKVTANDVPEIVEATLKAGGIVERLLFKEPTTGAHCKGPEGITFYKRQHRMTLKDCGHIDPEDIREYIAGGGYAAARQAWTTMTPKAICDEMLASGLRGRGGAGFPTGRKWEATRNAPGTKKYVVCNGDEGDPGAFMDRSVMEGNPHSVIEGLMIAGRAVGADEAYIYVRAEYPLAVRRLRKAVADATALGLLGNDVFATGTPFTVQVMEGAGAFVCGEETALLASIEGRRGMPSPKPPFPATCGLFRKPTVINNVETLATVPIVLRMGAREFRGIGTQGSPGSKTFALTGHVANTGLIEVPFGATLREVIFTIGGGVTDAKGKVSASGFKAVQIGGPSGGCLTSEHLDLPMDFDSLKAAGAMVGSGGLVVMNTTTCMVGMARYFMTFTQNESCGKCVLCREGTRQMLKLLDDITEGRATLETIDLLETLAKAVQKGSLCGLGKTAPNPVMSTLRYFRAEYEAHVVQKRCPAGACKALARPEIDATLCKGCMACVKKCPVGAISGERKMPHRIDPTVCIKCGACREACKFGAVRGV